MPTSKKPKSLNELYTAPDDDMMLAFAGKREHPGLLAGCSHGKVGANEWNCFHERIPQLSIDFTPFRDYEWAPLARRVDIDKVYQVIEDSKWFEGVEAVSFADFNPWSQMSLYKVDEYLIECEFRGIGSHRRNHTGGKHMTREQQPKQQGRSHDAEVLARCLEAEDGSRRDGRRLRISQYKRRTALRLGRPRVESKALGDGGVLVVGDGL